MKHLSIIQKLALVDDPQFQQVFDFQTEFDACIERLNPEVLEYRGEGVSVRRIRRTLREGASEQWASCKWQDQGVGHFRNNPTLNKFIYEKQVLSGGEWTNAIKLNTSYAPLRGVPGWSTGCQVMLGPSAGVAAGRLKLQVMCLRNALLTCFLSPGAIIGLSTP